MGVLSATKTAEPPKKPENFVGWLTQLREEENCVVSSKSANYYSPVDYVKAYTIKQSVSEAPNQTKSCQP